MNALLLVLEGAWVVSITAWLVVQRRSPVATLAWALVLALLPLVGLPLYLLVGPRRVQRRRLRYSRSRERVLDEPPVRALLSAGSGLPGPAQVAVSLGEPPPLAAEVRLLETGGACFQALVDAITAARHHVHLEYFIFAEGQVATALRDALVAACRRGVTVRLLVDAVGSFSLSQSFMAPLVAAGGQVARFNAVRFGGLRPWYVNFRTHRKVVVVDGVVGFTGGMNVDDVHDERVTGEKAWRDLHLELRGDVVAALQLLFLEDWCFSTGELPALDGLLAPKTGQGASLVQVVGSGPDHAWFAIYKQWMEAIASARRRVWLCTPYFVPDDAMLQVLIARALAGVEVTLLLPGKGDHAVVDAAARSYLPELLEAGVSVRRYEASMLHAKVLVVDDGFASVGTFNFDNRSFRLNFEVTATLLDEPSVAQVAERLARDLAGATPVSTSPGVLPWGERLAQGGARLFAPLL